MRRIPLKGSEIRPLVMAIEDLHWMDRSSEEVIKYLIESISGARILLIFTYRLEFTHSWGSKSYHSQVTLNRLSNRENLAMVAYLLGTEDIDGNIEELILEKTEGVPFFIEEFVKSLKDLKAIEKKIGRYHLAKDIQKVSIPSTIQDVIMARVDSLPEGVKEVLQIGSVIERELNYELLKRVTGLVEKELLSALSALKDSELLFERGIFPDSTYIFKHALTREVVYDSVLTRRKKKIHEVIGSAIEELYKDSIDEYYGILAEHYILSENYVKAAECYRLAGRKAERAVSFTNAISLAGKWVACLEKLPRAKDVERKMIDARTTLGFYKLQMQNFAEEKKAIDPIVDLALKHDYKKRLTQIYTIIGVNSYYIDEDFSKAAEFFQKAIELAEKTNNLISLIFATHYLGHVFVDDCEFEKGHDYIKKALDIVEMGNVLWSIAMHKACIAMNVYCAQGKIGLAYQTSNEALRLAEQSGDILSKTEAYVNHGVCCYAKGFLDEAEEHLLRGINLIERTNLIALEIVSSIALGRVYLLKREYKKAEKCYNKLMPFWRLGILGPSYFILTKIALASAKVMNDENDIDLRSLYAYASENKIKRWEGLIRRDMGEILLDFDDRHIPEAEKWIKQAIEADERHGMISELAQDYTVYAELFKRKSDLSKAKENLDKAIEILRECGADGWVAKYEKELAAIS